MKSFRQAASEGLLALSLFAGAAAWSDAAKAQSAKPAASAPQGDLNALIDQSISVTDDEYPPIEAKQALEKIRYAASLLMQHPETRKAFATFVKRGGKFIITDNQDIQKIGYAFYDEEKKAIYIQNFSQIDLITVFIAHELGHDRHVDIIKAMGHADKEPLNYTIGGFLRRTMFNEAFAQTLATDFAYELYLKGNPGPLSALLNISQITGADKSDTYEWMAKVYLGSLYKIDPRSEIDLNALPSILPDRIAALRPKAQAATFEAWFHFMGVSNVFAYAPKLITAYEIDIREIGDDDEVQARVRRFDKAHSVAVDSYGAENLRQVASISGVSFYKHLPAAKMIQDNYIFDRLTAWQQDNVHNLQTALSAYKGKKKLPIEVLDREAKVYSAAQADEYRAFEWRSRIDIEDYFEAKEKGGLAQAENFLNEGGAREMGITLGQYISLKAQGLLPKPEQWDKEEKIEGFDYATMRRAQFLYGMLRHSGDATLMSKGRDAVKRLKDEAVRHTDKRDAYMEEVSHILSSMICKMHGMYSKLPIYDYSKSGIPIFEQKTTDTLSAYYEKIREKELSRFRSQMPHFQSHKPKKAAP